MLLLTWTVVLIMQASGDWNRVNVRVSTRLLAIKYTVYFVLIMIETQISYRITYVCN